MDINKKRIIRNDGIIILFVGEKWKEKKKRKRKSK
jgi:hypothetical protein